MMRILILILPVPGHYFLFTFRLLYKWQGILQNVLKKMLKFFFVNHLNSISCAALKQELLMSLGHP